MSGRQYRVPISLTLGATIQEMWSITAGSAIPFWLEEIRLDPIATSISEYLLSMWLLTGSFTAASGGTTPTPAKANFNDTASAATARVGATTRAAVGTGVRTQVDAGQWNLVNGWVWQPIDPDHRIAVPASGAISISLDSTAVAATANGCLIFREMF